MTVDEDVVDEELDATGTTGSVAMAIFATDTDTLATCSTALELTQCGETLAARAGNHRTVSIIDFIPNVGVGLEGVEFEHGINILSTYRHCGR